MSVIVTVTDDLGGTTRQQIDLTIASDDDQISSGLQLPTPGKRPKTNKLGSPYMIGGLKIKSVVIGTNKKDKLTGTRRRDLIRGHRKRDELSSGKGKKADVFLLSAEKLGKRHADLIVDFESGDLIALDLETFKKGDKTKIKMVKNSKQLNRFASKKHELIYNKKDGELYFNENGKEEGFGDDGGLLATLKGTPKKGIPELSKDQFTYLDLLVSTDG